MDSGYRATDASFSGGTLVCNCASNPVKVKVSGDIAHNHACGCTKCWKPAGANFSVVAVAPTDKIEVLENGNKLAVVDPAALIQRHACKECGVHMHGPVEREHPFQGLSFIHPERFEGKGWAQPGFAAFVSSIIESGFDPSKIDEVRSKLRSSELEAYDCLSPGLMDYIATWTAKKSGAMENAITIENTGRIRAKLVAEAANGPVSFQAEKELLEKGVIILPDLFVNAGGVIVSYFEWVKNLTHIPFGLMERRRRERRNAQITSAMESMTGKDFPEHMRDEFLEGGSEIDLVRSGLDDVMRGAYHRMATVLSEHPEIRDFRTAAYYVALKEIGDAYKAIGI